MVLDNPFFVRDVRSLGRDFALLCRWLAFQSAALFLPLWLMSQMQRDVPASWAWGTAALPLFFLVHWLSLYLWGSVMGNRILLNEHQRRTLEALQLIARSPWRWLPEKLVFPLYGLFLIWAAGLPFYWILAVRNDLGVSELSTMAGLMWMPGVLGLAQSLLVSPEGWPGVPPLSGRRPAARWIEEALPSRWVHLHLGWTTFVGVLPWVLGYRPGVPGIPCFQRLLTPGESMGMHLGLVVLAGLFTGWSAANPGHPWLPAAARGVRLLCVAALHALFVGGFWSGADPASRAFWAIGAPAGAAALCRPVRPKGRRREDRRSEAEIRRIQESWDNPLFIRDLRALLRPASLGSAMARAVAEVFAVPMLLAALTFLLPGTAPREPLAEWLRRTGYLCAIFAPIWLAVAGISFAGRARRFWDAERQRDTLGQLVNSPLSAVEIVGGRWGAAGLRSAPGWAAALLCSAVGAWMLARTPGVVLTAYLILLALAALYGLGLGALGSGVAAPKPKFWHFLVVVPVAGGPIILLPYGIMAVIAPREAPEAMLPWLAAAFIGYPALVAGCFRVATRNIEWVRERDAGRGER